ncbi:recombination regulator RecX [Shouchella hunanensis]|uniref:Regulatory protein RecX n=1 Tax=Shouchella hunanensis TaxID=766894 RepID=A0ABY7W7M3_9BACI|nr:recombination regulator RecX [Shouchella hunanensis]WDF02715.1 recombination regulator RecX [Shouchella hunanensis]
MPIISKITMQKKAKQRYNIFVLDRQIERYSFSVDEDILIKYNLRKGMELDEDAMKEIAEADEAKKTFHLAIHYLSFRMRSEKEIKEYLVKKEREESHIAQAIQRLNAEGLIDDLAFAHAFVRSKVNQSFIGPTKLKQQLLEKGVAEKHIECALSEYDVNWEVNRLEKWKDKQDRKSGIVKDSKQQQLKKWQTQLMAKGFRYEAISRLMRTFTDEMNNNEEKQALAYQGDKLFRTYKKRYTEPFELKQKMIQALYRKGFSFDDCKAYVDEQMRGMSE